MAPQTALVAGATGYLGAFVCAAAKAAGYRVKALSRRPLAELPAALQASIDEVYVGEATNAESLNKLCEGVDVVFSSLGNRTLKRRPTMWEVDWQANMNILRSATDNGNIQRFVFVSVLNGREVRAQCDQIEARERVIDAIMEQRALGGFEYTIIRPTGFFNDMSDFLDSARGGTAWLLSDGAGRVDPIDGADLADVCVANFSGADSADKSIDVAGPDELTLRDIGVMACCSWENDREPKLRSVPMLVAKAVAGVVWLFNVNVASLLHMFIASAQAGKSRTGANAPQRFGSRHLRDFFKERVEFARADAGGSAAVGNVHK